MKRRNFIQKTAASTALLSLTGLGFRVLGLGLQKSPYYIQMTSTVM
jgi:hypothetical protein